MGIGFSGGYDVSSGENSVENRSSGGHQAKLESGYIPGL